jgi:heterodisulfide reductase subunit C
MTKKIELGKANKKLCQKICTLSGQMVITCDQCGTCSGSCPMAEEMDINPSEMMKMSQLGLGEVLETQAIWLCASCYTCAVRCPRGLDLSKVAEALRQIKLRQSEDHIDIKNLSPEELEALPQIALISACRKFTG